ncbi:MAG: hypothetical protein OHK0031_01550 [Anaerolineales bacterium]
MKARKFVSFFALALLAAATACTQRASTAPLSTPTSINFPQAVAATPGMSMIEQLATQTELAKTSLPLAGTPNTTPLALTINGTPQPVATTDPASALPVGATPLPSVTPDALQVNVPPSAVTPLPTVPVARPATYTLSAGEFPYCIARRFNVNPDDLLSLNGLNDGQILQPGLTLKIPQTGTFPANRALKAHPVSYTVLAGDTLASIACKFGDVDPINIAAVNGLSASAALTAGQTLQIP